MIPQRITLENFLSFGEPVTLDFTDNEPLWIIGGKNGVGKSAVFDAITFALFGQHRGGKLRIDELIRHGADGFRIVFEFAFDGVDYRITRAYRKKKHVPPKLDVRTGDDWQPLTGVTKVDELTSWVIDKLGMDCKAFTSSVLLKQGEADALLKSTRSERVDTLKNIIGFEQYEALSEKVKDAAGTAKDGLAAAKRLYDSLTPVEEAQIATATQTVDAAAASVQRAQAANDAAIHRIGEAKRWVDLDGKLRTVREWLKIAEVRAKTAADVKAKHDRLRDLTAMLPVLTNLSSLRTSIANQTAKQTTKTEEQAKLQRQHAEAQAAGEAAMKAMAEHQAALDVAMSTLNEAAKQLPQLQKFLEFGQETDALQKQLQGMPADLPEQVTKATSDEHAASEAVRAADAEYHQCKARLDTASENLAQMQNVKVGVKCSRCRQPVTAEHAKAEKKALTDEVETLTAAQAKAEAAVKKAKVRLTTVKTTLATVTKQNQERNALLNAIQNQTANLAKLGITASTTDLGKQIQQLEKQQQDATAVHQKLAPLLASAKATAMQQNTLATEADSALRKLEPELASMATAIAGFKTQITSELARLTPPWTEADIANLKALSTEQTLLRDERIEEKAIELQQDAAKIEQKQVDEAEYVREIETIDAADRISVAAANAAVLAAESTRKAAETALTTAKETLRQLTEEDQKYRNAVIDQRAKERAHGLHKKLNDLLGDQGLMRDLIRDAEREVVELADATLRQLTNQDLSLELDSEEEKAFALQVRKAGEDAVTAVEFISGSQRFRVAVSLALAIGRYAAGKRRPIEAVIIDEGFGSLDEDGLRAMAENLQELRRTQALKRIILVSHQKNFTEQFPAGYRLSPGVNGTTAERI